MQPPPGDSSWNGIIQGFGRPIPIRMSPTTREQAIELNIICREHGSRVEQVYQCEADGELCEPEDLTKAFIRPGLSMVVITAEDEAALDLDAEQAITITESRPIHAFDHTAVVQSYWAWTDGFGAREMASLWRALDREQMVAIGTMVMIRRLYPVALQAISSGKGTDRRRLLNVMRLRWPSEIRLPRTCTGAEAETVDTATFRATLQSLNRVTEPMLQGLANPRLVAMERLISDREEMDRKKHLAG